MKITLLMDTPTSWYYPHALKLKEELQKTHEVAFVHKSSDVPEGEIAFFLSCERLIKKEILARNKHNIVVHSSALPQGKGWSPLSWQILEGKNEIVSSLFEAVESVDAGDIYLQDTMHFDGHELLPELHDKQGASINSLVLRFVSAYPHINASAQTGEESFYEKRTRADSRLNPNKTIAEQFDLLRIVDNEKYPAFFEYRGHTYILKIYKDSNT